MKLIYSLFFFIAFLFSYAQQINSSLSKDEILIGDTVSLRVSIIAPDSIQLNFSKEVNFSPEVEVINDSFTTQKLENKINYKFIYTLTAWDKGIYTISSIPFEINDSILPSKNFSLNVVSPEVGDNSDQIFPLKPILEEEVSWWEANKKYLVYMIIGGLLLLIVSYLIYLYVKNRANNKYVSSPLLPPYEEAKQNLRRLDEKDYLTKNKFKEYYTDLSFIIRRYFDRRFEFPALAFISDDLVNYMQSKERLTEKEASVFLKFLKQADLIKYAKASATEEESLIFRRQVEELIDSTKPLLETEVLDHA